MLRSDIALEPKVLAVRGLRAQCWRPFAFTSASTMASDTAHLHLVRGRYYLKRRVPTALRDHYETAQISVPLKTSNLREARRRRDVENVKLEAQWDALRGAQSEHLRPGSREWLEAAAAEINHRLKVGEIDKEQAQFEGGHILDLYLNATHPTSFGSPEEHPGLTEQETWALRDLGERTLDTESVTLKTALAEYLKAKEKDQLQPSTLNAYRHSLGEFIAVAGERSFLHDTTAKRASEYIRDQVRTRGGSITTQRQRVADLSTWFGWCVSESLCEVNPFAGKSRSIRRSTRGVEIKERPWTNEELMTFLGNVPPPDQRWQLGVLALYTGARREEVCSWTVADVREEATILRVASGKTQAAVRSVPVHTVLRPLVEYLVDASTDGYLLSGQKPMGADLRRGKYLGKQFLAKARALKLTGISFHDLRRTTLRALHDAGVPESISKCIVGHTGGITYGTYARGADLAVIDKALQSMSFGSVDALVVAGIEELTA